jgi:hypothetical protein
VILKSPRPLRGDPRPIRSELFGLERLEQHARTLAKAQTVSRKAPRNEPLPRRLKVNYAALCAHYRLLAEAGKAGKSVTSAGELFAMLNPVNHTRSRSAAQRYRVEPYVACADVYSVTPHVGRGGWTWYTGSAAWMYRVGVEHILGLRFQGDRLHLSPAIPSHWPGFEAIVRKNGGELRIAVENPHGLCGGVLEMTLDGQPIDAAAGIPLTAGQHGVRVVIRPRGAVRPEPSRSTSFAAR